MNKKASDIVFQLFVSLFLACKVISEYTLWCWKIIVMTLLAHAVIIFCYVLLVSGYSIGIENNRFSGKLKREAVRLPVVCEMAENLLLWPIFKNTHDYLWDSLLDLQLGL